MNKNLKIYHYNIIKKASRMIYFSAVYSMNRPQTGIAKMLSKLLLSALFLMCFLQIGFKTI